VTTGIVASTPVGVQILLDVEARASSAAEWTATAEVRRPLPVQVMSWLERRMSWLERRYAETRNGAYAIGGLQTAIRAHGRIDEPWLLNYLGEIADALFAGAQESGSAIMLETGCQRRQRDSVSAMPAMRKYAAEVRSGSTHRAPKVKTSYWCPGRAPAMGSERRRSPGWAATGEMRRKRPFAGPEPRDPTFKRNFAAAQRYRLPADTAGLLISANVTSTWQRLGHRKR
jgi:hypothetical protein